MDAACEAVQEKKVQTGHCKATLLIADGVTKPLEG